MIFFYNFYIYSINIFITFSIFSFLIWLPNCWLTGAHKHFSNFFVEIVQGILKFITKLESLLIRAEWNDCTSVELWLHHIFRIICGKEDLQITQLNCSIFLKTFLYWKFVPHFFQKYLLDETIGVFPCNSIGLTSFFYFKTSYALLFI